MFGSYDFIARLYPVLERAAFGSALTEARNASLKRVISAEQALLIGEGNGRFLADCIKAKIGGSITIVDASERMLSLARSRICGFHLQTELKFVHADFREWRSSEPHFDVIVTHFFLDLFRPESQRRVIENITAHSTANTIWMNVDSRPVIQSPLHRLIDWLQYRFDRLFSGIEAERHYDSAAIIQELGWRVQHEQAFCSNAVFSHVLTRFNAH